MNLGDLNLGGRPGRPAGTNHCNINSRMVYYDLCLLVISRTPEGLHDFINDNHIRPHVSSAARVEHIVSSRRSMGFGVRWGCGSSCSWSRTRVSPWFMTSSTISPVSRTGPKKKKSCLWQRTEQNWRFVNNRRQIARDTKVLFLLITWQSVDQSSISYMQLLLDH